MKRHLCIWLPDWPVPNAGQLGGDQAGAPPEPAADTGISLDMLADRISRQICPLVAIETLDDKPWAGQPGHQSQSLLCEITGVSHLFGGEAGLLTAVDQLLTPLGLTARQAIADSVGAAWAVAHYGNRDRPIVPPRQDRRALEPLPVESLRIGVDTAATLSRLGVHQVGPLLRLPRSGLAPRLGRSLVRRIEQALGEVAEPIAVYHPPVQHVARDQLEYPTGDQKILADRLGRLIEEVRTSLASRQQGALRMTCRLDLVAHPPLTLNVGLFVPTIDAEHLADLMTCQLDKLKLPSAVEQLTVSVPLTGRLRHRQRSLFARGAQAAERRFSENPVYEQYFSEELGESAVSRLVNSLSNRLGSAAVVGIRISDNPLPEQAFEIQPLAGNDQALWKGAKPLRYGVRSGSAIVLTSPADAMRRPLSLRSKPLPIAVVVTGRVPRQIRLRGKVHWIIRYWGPERIETSWWNGPSIRRDYYRIETDSGQWWWIFRNLTAGVGPSSWMLHGQFT